MNIWRDIVVGISKKQNGNPISISPIAPSGTFSKKKSVIENPAVLNEKGFPLKARLLMVPYESLMKRTTSEDIKVDWSQEEVKPNKITRVTREKNRVFPTLALKMAEQLRAYNLHGMRQLKHFSTRSGDKGDEKSSSKSNMDYREGCTVCEPTPQGAAGIPLEASAYNMHKLAESLQISEQVIANCDGDVGPGASKTGIYKNPEYYCYHPMSFLNAQLEMMPFRLPQPSNKPPPPPVQTPPTPNKKQIMVQILAI